MGGRERLEETWHCRITACSFDVSNRTLAAFRYLSNLWCGESLFTAQHVNNKVTLPGIDISSHIVRDREDGLTC
jgi:hypothetical protein